jgi:hypothetical protein
VADNNQKSQQKEKNIASPPKILKDVCKKKRLRTLEGGGRLLVVDGEKMLQKKEQDRCNRSNK